SLVRVTYYQRRHDAEPDSALWMAKLADALRGLCALLTPQPGGAAEALDYATRAVTLSRRVVSQQPDAPAALRGLIASLKAYRAALFFAAAEKAGAARPEDVARLLHGPHSPEAARRRSAFHEMMEVLERLVELGPPDAAGPRRPAPAHPRPAAGPAPRGGGGA